MTQKIEDYSLLQSIRKKFEVRKKLDEEGYKKEIFKHVKNPSAFKWHLLNEVTIEDESMFFTDPPMNKDKEQLIKDSHGRL